jgi:hypothetical protein
MVRIQSFWIKVPVTLLLIVMIFALYAIIPVGSERAITLVGAILLTEGYILGIDSTIVKRIVRMKPLSRIINGLYYLVLGVLYLVIMSVAGDFVFAQFAFIVFVCILGVGMLIYQLRKGEEVRGKRFKLGFALSTLLVAIGSDIGVTALFFSVFVIFNYTTGVLFFILGYIIRGVGSFIGNKMGVAKEELFAGEEPSSK